MSVPVTLFLSGPGNHGLRMLCESRSRALHKDDRICLLLNEDQTLPEEEKISLPSGMSWGHWLLKDENIHLDTEIKSDDWNVLLYSDVQPPMDWLESMLPRIQSGDWEVTRVITLVDTKLAIESSEARRWYQACIHFSDLVLLGNRDGLNPKDVAGFQEYFEKERYPCHFDLVKNGIPKHPSWMLDSQPRRLSLVFDPPELTGHDLPVWEDEEEDEDGLDEDMDRYVDPYLEKNHSGERVRRVPLYPESPQS